MGNFGKYQLLDRLKEKKDDFDGSEIDNRMQKRSHGSEIDNRMQKRSQSSNVDFVNSNCVDRMLDDLMVPAGEYDTPPTPVLPWWFTSECESQLLAASDPPSIQIPVNIPPVIAGAPVAPPAQSLTPAPLTPSSVSPRNVPSLAVSQSSEQIKEQLKAQLEYYFSRENLMTDRFLRCQMDNDQYVPIRIVAGFPKVKRLTNDYNLVVKVLRESSQVQVDEKGERVRAVSKRCTIILREIPESTDEKEVAAMFAGGPSYLSLQYGLNNSWYVTFESEEATQRAFLHLQNLGKTFNNKPICARIKTGGAPYSESLSLIPELSSSVAASETPIESVLSLPATLSASSPSLSDNFDLGQILASYGYVPCATFKPGATVVQVTSTVGLITNRIVNQQRLRGGSHFGQTNSHFRGSSSRPRGGFVYNQRVFNGGYRDLNPINNYQHSSGRRNHSDPHRDGYRDKNGDLPTYFRPRGRQNPSNYHNHYAMRSRTPIESQKICQNDFVRQHPDCEQQNNRIVQIRQQRNKQKDMLLPKTASGTNGKSMACPSIICFPPDECQKSEEQQNYSKTTSDDDSKPETNGSRKTDDTEYSFEEGAFPCLSEEMPPSTAAKEKKLREKPTFSSVAAGKRKEKETKEKKSYAQTLKQNNGLLQAS